VGTAFLSHPLRGIGTTYDVHLGVTGKRVVNFLIMLIEFFSLCVTDEALTSEYRFKIDDFAPTGAG